MEADIKDTSDMIKGTSNLYKWPPKSGAHKKKGYWARLRRKQKKYGVIEIDCRHPRYERVSQIKKGLQEVLTSDPELGPKDILGPDDYSHTLKKSIKAKDGKELEFVSYASAVFATLRRAMGISESDFLQSVAPENLPYLEFISNSKSGQDFYISNNQAYFMKTERKKFVERFTCTILGKYLQHFLQYPHSLIVKYLGLYSLKQSGKKTCYIFIMQSIFYPQDRIEQRYDLKGCLVNRFQKPPEDGSVVTVLKDRNLGDGKIIVGPQSSWLCTQLEHDVRFLEGLGAIDYSLLLGFQRLHDNERDQHLGDIVTRVKKSIKHANTEFQTDGSMTSIIHGSSDALGDTDSEYVRSRSSSLALSEGTFQNGHKAYSLRRTLNFGNPESMEDNIHAHNLRLLPHGKNPLHTIDGPDYRYYIGIIDFFMPYGMKQRAEKVLKGLVRCSCDHSSQHPTLYAQRWLEFMTSLVQ